MEKQTLHLLNEVNRAIIQFRGIYAAWSSMHHISYHEMLVLYTIREKGFCNQKQICNRYLLPRQTINNVITKFRKDGILTISEEHSHGREKGFVLTEKGKQYAQPFLESLDAVETEAVELLGKDKLEALTVLILEYNQALNHALKEKR